MTQQPIEYAAGAAHRPGWSGTAGPPAVPGGRPTATATMPAAESGHPCGNLPPEFAAVMRPELPGLVQEVSAEIRRAIPEYAEPADEPTGASVRLIVEQALGTFVERVGDPRCSTERRDELFRCLGRHEAEQGRGLDTMQTALRIGVRLALHRGRGVARRRSISGSLVIAFADQLFAYIDELVEIAREGHRAARAQTPGDQESRRRLLAEVMRADAPSPRTVLTELAERARWPIPDQVALIAYARGRPPARGAVEPDMLVDFEDPQPYALCPAPVDAARRARWRAALGTVRAAVGPPVALEEAARSLRWARRGLRLAEAGVIDAGPLIDCEEHLVTLCLFADPELADTLVRRQLAFLDALTPMQRRSMTETLRAWLDTRGATLRMAELLHLHPQTVRYRVRNLEKACGGRLTDPDRRFAIELALRALEPRLGDL
ncbi:helix-turn-helix domain-containing protein [Streptomyces sp. KLOTTS4A1]|uniref:PucR family transcriptional regulator n=1 Tax=Streptomyces sp. KLOTTS4A1 TaxID=3390996 RepID=UPI0039F5DD82